MINRRIAGAAIVVVLALIVAPGSAIFADCPYEPTSTSARSTHHGTDARTGQALTDPVPASNVVYQYSTIQAMLDGQYDGDLTCGELKRRGDFGIGTFNALDGEMLLIGGQVFRIPGSGRPQRVSDGDRTPFATVMFFRPEQTNRLLAIRTITQFRATIERLLPNHRDMFALHVQGEFEQIKTRSVPKQAQPYRRLIDIVPTQPTFERHNVRGQLVGFWFPESLEGVNVAGLHLHFLSDDETFGGHLLECRIKMATMQCCRGTELVLRPPAVHPSNAENTSGSDQRQAPAKHPLRDELNRVER